MTFDNVIVSDWVGTDLIVAPWTRVPLIDAAGTVYVGSLSGAKLKLFGGLKDLESVFYPAEQLL